MHFEIGCRDKARTAEFFSKLFDWNTQEAGPATMIDTGAGSGINGHITSLGHEPHNYVTIYVVGGRCAGISGQSAGLGRQGR